MAGALGSGPVSGTGQAFRRNDEGNQRAFLLVKTWDDSCLSLLPFITEATANHQ
jgi:hypothetical protein